MSTLFKRLLPFILLLFTSMSFGQAVDIATGPAKPLIGDPSAADVSYDKFKDVTHVGGGKTKLSAQGKYAIIFPDVTFTTGGTFFGEKPKDIVRYFLYFSFESPDWVFLRTSTDLIVLADTVRLSLGKGTRTGDVLRGRSKVMVAERLMYHIDQKQMETIANAKTVELQIGGGFESVLGREQTLQMLNVLAAVAQKK